MPTTGRSIRINDERWIAAGEKAVRTGRPISDVVNVALEMWITAPDMTEVDYLKLEEELDEIDYAHEVWSVEALKRREAIIIILAKAGRL